MARSDLKNKGTAAAALAERLEKAEQKKQATQTAAVAASGASSGQSAARGSYYSPREYGSQASTLNAQVEAARSAMEERTAALTASQKAMETAREAAEQRKARYYALKDKFVGDSAESYRQKLVDEWTTAVQEYGTARERYQAAYDEYKPLEDAYNAAASAYSSYVEQEEADRLAWKSTIRDAETIRDEQRGLKGMRPELRHLMQQSNDIAAGTAAPGVQAQAAQIEARIKELQGYLGEGDEREKLLEEELGWSEYFRYEDLRGNTDFAEKSQYASTANGGKVYADPLGGGVYGSSFDDPMYDYINRNAQAITEQNLNSRLNDISYLQSMTDEEVAMYNYVYATEGEAGANAYLDTIRTTLTARQQGLTNELVGEMATSGGWAGPVVSSAVSVGLSPLSGLQSLAGQLASVAAGMEIDPNAGYNLATNTKNAIREAVGAKAEEAWGPVGSFGYSVGMSMLDMLADASFGSAGMAQAFIGSRAAAESVMDAKNRGLSDGKALTLGLISSVAELATERIGLDELLKLKDADAAKSLLGRVWAGATGEALEEGATNVINQVADILVAGDKSSWQQSMAAYQEEGLTEREAFIRALGDAALSLGADMLGGMVSGGVFGGFDRSGQSGVADVQQVEENAAEGAVGASEAKAKASGKETAEPSLKEAALRENNPLISGIAPTVESQAKDQRLEKAETNAQVTGILYGVDDTRIEEADRLGAVLGKGVFFFAEDPTEYGIKHGVYDTAENSIGVNAKSSNVLAATVGHELTHSIEDARSYAKLRDLVFERIAETGEGLETLRQSKRELYTRNGVELDAEGVDREIVARYVEEHLLTDEESIRAVVRDDRSVARRILDWLDDLLAKFGNKKSQEREFVRKARDIYRTALAEADALRGRRDLADAARQAYADGDDAAGDALWEARYADDPEGLLDPDFGDYDPSHDGELEWSIAETADGDLVAVVDNDILAGLDISDWDKSKKRLAQNLAREALRKHRGEIPVQGLRVVINNRTEREFTRSDYTDMLSRRKPAIFLDKMRAADVVDDLVMVATNWDHDTDLKHDRTDFNAFYRGETLLAAGDNRYEATVVVGCTPKGENVLYDLVDITPASFQIKESEPSTAAPANKPPSVIQEDSDIVSISDSEKNVKRYSIGDPEEGGFTKGWHDDDEAARAAKLEGYPVLDGVQVVPMKTWVRARDFKKNPDGSIFYDKQGDPVQYDNYGLVAGLGSKPGTLKVNFHNKSVVNEETGQTLRRDGVEIAVEDLAPTPGVFRQTDEDFESLIGQAPEEPGAYGYTDAELAEIEELRSRAEMEADGAEERETWTPVEREGISGRAREYLGRVEKRLAAEVAGVLDVPGQARREFLTPIVEELTGEYLRNGTIIQEVRDRLFETAWEQGRVVDQEFYDTYKEVKDYLRTTGVTLSETDRDSRDWGEFRKSAFGTVKIVNEGGLPVDAAWGELQEMAPALFPSDILNPEDQLRHMVSVGKSIQKVERTLDEHYGPDAEFAKAMSRNDFDAAVASGIRGLWEVKRFADERLAEASAVTDTGGSELTAEEVTALYPALKEARRAADRAVAKNLLTKRDKEQVQRLLRGDIQPEHLDPGKDNVKGILAVYEAKKAFEEAAAPIRKWNRQRKARNYAEAEELISGAGEIVDKKRGIAYSRETMERNIRDIVKDKGAAERIIQTYFMPVHDGAAAATRMKSQYRDRVRALNLSRKVAKGNVVSEAYAVQFYGEVSDILRLMEESKFRLKRRDGKTYLEWKAELRKLWEENPGLDQEKVKTAAQEFGNIYEELFAQMNEARVRNGYEPVNHRSGYFPHFQQEGRDGILNQFGKALGIDVEVQQLPTTINGLTHTFKPGIRWFCNALERRGFDTAYDAVEGFDRYIEGVADVVHQTDNIQRLRALANQLRYRTSDEGLREQIRKIQERTDLTDDEKDALIREKTKDGKFELSNFVVELDEYTNLLANKKSRADRDMEQAMGRDMYNIVKGLESRVAANMVAINPGSWLTNFIPITQGWACLDTKHLMQGMSQTVRAMKVDDGVVDRSSFLTGRQGSDALVKTWAQEWSGKLSSPMEWIDNFTAGTLVRGRYAQNLSNGMSAAEAMSEADDWTAGVMADRTKGSMPTLFHRSNPLTKLFTQFQLEVNNQISYIKKDIPRQAGTTYGEAARSVVLFVKKFVTGGGVDWDKKVTALALALLKFALGAWAYNELYELLFGRRPALDPIDMLTGAVADVMDEEKDLWDAAANLGGKVAENTPFIGGLLGGGRVPISSALPDVETLGKALLNDDWGIGKKVGAAAKELAKPGLYVLPPFGGGQIKKIWEGLKMIAQGGSYTLDADGNPLLQYPLQSSNSAIQSALEAGQAVIFGKTTIRSGREWVEGGFGNLTAEQTATYQALLALDVSQADAFELMQELRSAEKTDMQSRAAVRRDILRASGLEGDALGVVYYDLMVEDESDEKIMLDTLRGSGADMGAVANVMMDIKDAESSNRKRDAIAASGLTDAQKRELYRLAISENWDDEIEAFSDVGLKMNDFLEAQNAYTDIKEQYEDEGDMATAFARWVNKQGYTTAQKEVVRDSLKYWQMMPASAGRYDKAIDAGLGDEDAYELASELDALEPLEGKTSVQDIQKWRVAVDNAWTDEGQLQMLQAAGMTGTTYEKVSAAWDAGIAPAAWVRAQELRSEFDADGNGSLTNADWTKLVDSMTTYGVVLPGNTTMFHLTAEQKGFLWQMLTGSKSTKNNPYSAEGGERYLAAKEAMK